ncbi:hypothetical protein [Streptomyces sp. NBC_00347]|uniref:hypothetical protein n=1 Tax=Streptomyces sp. NBC_00347 TaxID=2975721 RepID=UPI002254445A|nr:hypothetical protein [Streptomyces sp. NBC_00347]MCX5124241.1 hypothetical protein [Streptomyces sp. NBC_00347]
MTEPQNDVTPAEVPAPPAEPAGDAAHDAAFDAAHDAATVDAPAADPAVVDAAPGTGRRVGRRPLALIAGGVAAAVLVGGGVWASTVIADADRDAPTAYWVPIGAPAPKAVEPGSVPANALSGKLLPMPDDFRPGPDIGSDGNDFVLSGEQALEGFKEARTGLSSTERKKRDEMLAQLKLQGLAGRTYTTEMGGWIAEVRIMQADPKAVGSFSEVTKKLIELGGDKREAPKVDGFPDAKCALLAIGLEEGKEKIDSIDCTAVEGDIAVTFRAYGPKPFSIKDAVGFFKNQMSHLKSPGESV